MVGNNNIFKLAPWPPLGVCQWGLSLSSGAFLLLQSINLLCDVIPDFHERHLTKCHTSALSQVITHTGIGAHTWAIYVLD